MAKYILHLPIDAYDAVQDLQERILAYDVDHETAQFEMERILAPYTKFMPQPGDQTEIRLQTHTQVDTYQ